MTTATTHAWVLSAYLQSARLELLYRAFTAVFHLYFVIYPHTHPPPDCSVPTFSSKASEGDRNNTLLLSLVTPTAMKHLSPQWACTVRVSGTTYREGRESIVLDAFATNPWRSFAAISTLYSFGGLKAPVGFMLISPATVTLKPRSALYFSER